MRELRKQQKGLHYNQELVDFILEKIKKDPNFAKLLRGLDKLEQKESDSKEEEE